MKVSLLVSLTVLLSIGGCATPNDLRNGKPYFEFKSSRTPRQVAACIADHWENGAVIGGTMPITMRDLENGYMISLLCGDGRSMCLMADVTALSESGSNVSIYEGGLWGKDRFTELAERCK